ncbi:MAG: 2,4'-dihydroxyacetophenone dioxygenase family protein [Actinomycetia bacterium]|nr:2,4'-dihydroxyacetophenone dioxygenase family protein [Actinomycetes bacterium]
MSSTTSPIAPAPASTSTGAALPLVALPQTELLTVNEQDIPLIKDMAGGGAHFKPLRLDIENGVWVVLATFEAGARIPLHYHTGEVDAWTISGSWHYVEYPDQVQTAGSYLFEPAASVHTLYCPESNTEDTVVFFRVKGANINFNDDGTFHSIQDAALLTAVVGGLAAEQNLGPVNYLTGGTVTFAGKDS